MPIVSCPSCQRQLSLPDEHIGKAVRCPACATTFKVGGPPPRQQPPAPVAVEEYEVFEEYTVEPVTAPRQRPGRARHLPEEAPEGPAAFQFEKGRELQGIRVRVSVSSAAGWLRLSAVLGSLVAIASFSVLVYQALAANFPLLIAAALVGLLIGLAPNIIVLLGANRLEGRRSYGLAMTAAIVALILAALALIPTLLVGLALVALLFGGGFAVGLIVLGPGELLLLGALIAYLVGGIKGLIVLNKQEVKDAFRR